MSLGRHNSRRILAYGHDAVLLQTRCMVLRNAGFQVDEAHSADELKTYMAEAQVPYGLLLVGHTIPDTELPRIMRVAAGSSTLVHRLSEPVDPGQLIRELFDLLNGASRVADLD
jgi:hypothetical protein